MLLSIPLYAMNTDETLSTRSNKSSSWISVFSTTRTSSDTAADGQHSRSVEDRLANSGSAAASDAARPRSMMGADESRAQEANPTLPQRWRRTRSQRSRRFPPTLAQKSFDGQTLTRSTSTSSWTEGGTTLAPTTPVLEPPLPAWTLKLPDEVVTTPSLVTLMHDELQSRGIYSPRPTFETSRPRPSNSVTRHSRSMSIRSALSSFAPHPGVRRLLWQDGEHNDDDDDRLITESLPRHYPDSLALWLVMLSICLSVFNVSIDRGMMTTAIPSIAADFRAFTDIGWYGSAYFLTASAFQPLYGRIYTSFDAKWSYLVAIAMFELGSLTCALSPNSNALVIGRAIQGLGSAGALTGSFVVGTHSVRLQYRAMLFACIGILYSIGAIVGPILGGVFSDRLNWRWCFYINLPVGAITFVVTLLFCNSGQPYRARDLARQSTDLSAMSCTLFRRLKALDWVGNALFTAACVSLFLALQWSQDSSSRWSSPRCIGTIGLSGVTFVVFAIWLWWRGDEALIPLHILRQRTVAVSCVSAFFIHGAMLTHTYYLPIWLQAIKGTSAINSGIYVIPYMLTSAIFSLAAGILVAKNGLYAPPAVVGCAIATVGAGLLATLQATSSIAICVGFQTLVSAGLGMAIQQGFSAVSATLPLHEVPIGTAAVVACQSAGGAIFISVGTSLLQNRLFDASIAGTIQGIDVQVVIEQGVTNFRDLVPTTSLPSVLDLYNHALQSVFVAAVPLCGAAFVCSLFMEWKPVRQGDLTRPATRQDIEASTNTGFGTPELGSDASTLAHLAPRARARWSQKWKLPRCETRPQLPRLNVAPEFNSSEKTPAQVEIKHPGSLAAKTNAVDIQLDFEKDEIGKAISV